MTKAEHDRMIHEFVGLLDKAGIDNYATEHPIRLDDRNLGYVDVIVWDSSRVFLFDMKSGSEDISTDIQRVKKYAYSLSDTENTYSQIYTTLVYGIENRDKISEVRNLFKDVEVLFLDEKAVIVDLDGEVVSLKEIIQQSQGRLSRLRRILRIILES